MSSTVCSPISASLPMLTGPVWMTPATARYPVNDDSLRITVSSPMVSMSVQTGTVLEKMTTRRPILAPSARRYSG